MQRFLSVMCLVASASAFVAPMAPMRSQLSASKVAAQTPKMSMDVSVVEQLSSTMAGVVAVDGGTIGLDVSFGAFLAVILGLFIPVV